MKVTRHVSINYDWVFPGEPKPSIAELLATIPSRNSLELLGHFSAQIHVSERDSGRQIRLLQMWKRLPMIYKARLDTAVDEIRSNADARFVFMTNTSILLLEQHTLANFNELPRVSDLTGEQELNFLKAYLLCTDEWTNKQSYGGEDRTTPEGLARLLMKIQFPYQEILELKDFRVQFVKAIYFFRFCENNPTFRNFAQIFYKENGVKSWDEYLYNLLSSYIRRFEEGAVASRLIVGDKDKNIQDFLRQFCVDPKNFRVSDDFTGLREKPIFEFATNDFLFLSLNFFVDKFFQGIQFVMSQALIKQSVEYKGKPMKSFSQFKSIYGEELSEKGILYSTLNHIFQSPGYSKFTGEQLKEKIHNGEPDYYVRAGNKIILFEYKDVLLNAEIKHSYDFEKIKEEVFKKFVENEKSSPKGVSQLINCIEKITTGEYSKVDAIDFKGVEIYPIIIFTEFPLNIAGVNYILNGEFRRLLAGRGLDTLNIKDLVLVDLNSLILFQDIFQSDQINFISSIEEFIKETKIKGHELATYTMKVLQMVRPFNNITPKILLDVAKGMIKK